MLELKDIYKDYPSGDEIVRALKGVTIKFRDSEFVSILGQSGCGKTTLLNIIGGLDHYTTGDLVINGRSTKGYNDKDWDTYRNHSIGFVFQSYNLIPHQTVLRNVELALTISGVKGRERTRRATEALVAVGLGDRIHMRPGQLSGGQMQRVAIARALVNNPDIVLADEPTGALDSETSVQVMEILKKVAETKLVIMVTHNPELAQRYSTRIVRLLDGRITEDSDPFELNVAEHGALPRPLTKRERRRAEKAARRASGKGKRRMSFLTALGLSMRNLATKKGRTILTAFAGSIGIIGIALILSLSNGAQEYINGVEQDTLSSYPIQIQSENVDMSALMSVMGAMGGGDGSDVGDSGSGDGSSSESQAPSKVTTNNIMTNIIQKLGSGSSNNDLKSLRDYIENGNGHQIYDLANDVRYGYDTTLYVYGKDVDGNVLQVNPSTVMSTLGIADAMGATDQTEDQSAAGSIVSSMSTMSPMMSSYDVWDQLMNNGELLSSQYDVLSGRMPESYDEVVLITDKNGRISDYLLYSLGMKDQSDVNQMLVDVVNGKELDAPKAESYSFDDFVGMTFKLVPSSDFYQKQADGTWKNMKSDQSYMDDVYGKAEDLKIVGVIRPKDNAAIEETQGAIGYRADLTEHVVNLVNESDVAKAQQDSPDTDIFTGLPFGKNDDGTLTEAGQEAQDAEKAAAQAGGSSSGAATASAEPVTFATVDDALAYAQQLAASDPATAAAIQTGVDQMRAAGMTDDVIAAQLPAALAQNGVTLPALGPDGTPVAQAAAVQATPAKTVSDATYEGNLRKIGVSDVDSPSTVEIYARDFDAKEQITKIIDDYNTQMKDAGEDGKVIQYSDYVGLMMSSVRTVIDAISYILIAFVAISLVVSSIMIGIITYISVLERTKEIGILRAIGASKRDVSRVFNAETFAIGLISGLLGIGVTLLAIVPINVVVYQVAGVANLAALPWQAALILIGISVVLTYVGGLIPAHMASKKDPVLALRTE